MKVIGYTIGEATTNYVTFISKITPMLGEYVVLEYNEMSVLGIIRSLTSGSISLREEIYDPLVVEKIRALEGKKDHYIKGLIKILGEINTLKIPRIPPPPATEVKRADDEILRRIFANNEKGVRLGVLVSNPEVPVYVDVNRMISRHLAILAITGAGKSNTVAVITDGILKHGGAVLIFDMHSEYIGAKFMNGKVNKIFPKINPLDLDVSELMRLMNIGREAHKEEYYLRKALSNVREKIFKGKIDRKKFFCALKSTLELLVEKSSYDKRSIISVINKLDGLLEKYGDILDVDAPSILDQLKLRHANVIDLGALDEEAADVIVSHSLRVVLNARKMYRISKRGLSFPLFTILEEAHILAPKDRITLSKYWISRIAREGRKFGLGICLVSQRPKVLDPDTLSQANNMVVLRLVEPSDQRYVQQASETLSEDLLDQLSSLNIGEAIVLGLMVKIPVIVKIDKFNGKTSGGDIDIIGEWKKSLLNEKRKKEDFENLMGGW